MKRTYSKIFMKYIFIIIFVLFIFSGCGEKEKGIGTGPVKFVELEALNPELAESGKEIFDKKCRICHLESGKGMGPSLQGITAKRKPEWIMNMILNPEGMIKEDSEARELAKSFKNHMYKQTDSEEEARKILEYLRQTDEVR